MFQNPSSEINQLCKNETKFFNAVYARHEYFDLFDEPTISKISSEPQAKQILVIFMSPQLQLLN